MTRLLAICNPDNRRTTLLARAVRDAGWRFDRFAYRSLLENFEQSWPHLARRVRQADVIRLDSPAEDFAVEKLLLQWGSEPADAEGTPSISSAAAGQLLFDRGRILFPRQAYLGYARLLNRLASALPDAPWMNLPAHVLRMFDKPSTSKWLLAAGIPMPLHGGVVENYDELCAVAKRHGWTRVFAKIANGSSASGVVAMQWDSGRVRATTSVETASGELYNSLRPQHYEGESEVRALIDALACHRLLVERWLPKAAVDGHEFDLRIVVTAGEPSHYVVRLSQGSPMTNLHLGNQRGDLPRLRARMGHSRWEAVQDLCRRTAAAFPGTHYAGLDIMLSPDMSKLHVIECNAYGDLLPGIVDDAGLTPQQRQLRDWPVPSSNPN